MKTCDRCRTPFKPGSNRARWCSPGCRRAARSEYEEARAAHAYAGARHDPAGLPGFVPEADAADAMRDVSGFAAFVPPHGDRERYLDARREYLTALAAVRRRLGMTLTAAGWRIPPPRASRCHRCPIMRLPVHRSIFDGVEREALAIVRRRAIEESLDSN